MYELLPFLQNYILNGTLLKENLSLPYFRASF